MNVRLAHCTQETLSSRVIMIAAFFPALLFFGAIEMAGRQTAAALAALADAFGIPPLEAMACGLPVIISRQSGVSELVTHGVDACILENPAEPAELATLIRRLYEDEEFRGRLGRNAAQTAAACTWKRNAEQLRSILQKVIAGQAQAIPGSRVT